MTGRGALNPRWKGGVSLDGHGYLTVSCDGRRRLQHVVIVEKAIGRPLPPGASVHHVNGNRADNSPGNLVVCQDMAYHHILHMRQRALAATGDPNARRCVRCHGYDRQEDFAACAHSKGSNQSYHLSCNRDHHRALRARRRSAKS